MSARRKSSVPQRQDEWRAFIARLDPVGFGKKVTAIRVRQNQSLENVSRKIGEPDVVLKLIEAGEQLVTESQIRRIARALNTKPTRLVEPETQNFTDETP